MKVQLIKPHTHAGVEYAPDAVIEVSAAEAAWLAARGVIQQGNKRARWLKPVPDTHDEESQA